MKSRDGFTFVELIIVIAIIAIITAIVTPNLIGATNKSKVRSDVQSAMTIQNAIDIYIAEHGVPPVTGMATGIEAANAVIKRLQEVGSIKDGVINPQTDAGSWTYDVSNRKFTLDISASPINGRPEITGLSEADLQWLTGLITEKK